MPRGISGLENEGAKPRRESSVEVGAVVVLTRESSAEQTDRDRVRVLADD